MARNTENPRPRRVAERLVMELGEILATRVEDPRLRTLTVTGAKVSRDLSVALIWIAGPITEGGDEDVQAALKHATPYLRSLLAARMTLRIVPTLKFIVDRSIDAGARIDALLREIAEPKDE